jgi:hypothetical protein
MNLRKLNIHLMTDKKIWLLTAVWRNGGFRAKINGSNSNKHLCLVDSEVLLNPPLLQAANR